MRARLNSMAPGEQFHFLCEDKMAEKIGRVIEQAGGEVLEKDTRSYGVVFSVRKKQAVG